MSHLQVLLNRTQAKRVIKNSMKKCECQIIKEQILQKKLKQILETLQEQLAAKNKEIQQLKAQKNIQLIKKDEIISKLEKMNYQLMKQNYELKANKKNIDKIGKQIVVSNINHQVKNLKKQISFPDKKMKINISDMNNSNNSFRAKDYRCFTQQDGIFGNISKIRENSSQIKKVNSSINLRPTFSPENIGKISKNIKSVNSLEPFKKQLRQQQQQKISLKKIASNRKKLKQLRNSLDFKPYFLLK